VIADSKLWLSANLLYFAFTTDETHLSLLSRFGRVKWRMSICSTAMSLRSLVTLATSFSLILAISFRCTSNLPSSEASLNVINLKPRQTSCEITYPFHLFYHEFLFAICVVRDDSFLKKYIYIFFKYINNLLAAVFKNIFVKSLQKLYVYMHKERRVLLKYLKI